MSPFSLLVCFLSPLSLQSPTSSPDPSVKLCSYTASRAVPPWWSDLRPDSQPASGPCMTMILKINPRSFKIKVKVLEWPSMFMTPVENHTVWMWRNNNSESVRRRAWALLGRRRHVLSKTNKAEHSGCWSVLSLSYSRHTFLSYSLLPFQSTWYSTKVTACWNHYYFICLVNQLDLIYQSGL